MCDAQSETLAATHSALARPRRIIGRDCYDLQPSQRLEHHCESERTLVVSSRKYALAKPAIYMLWNSPKRSIIRSIECPGYILRKKLRDHSVLNPSDQVLYFERPRLSEKNIKWSLSS